MSETSTSPAELNQTSRPVGIGQRLGAWLRSNPVVVKELRGRMRGRRAFLVLTLYLLALSLVLILTYLLYLASINSTPAALTNTRQMIGKIIFAIVVGMQLACITFIAPALTSGAISAEREHQTYDLLRATLLSARALVMGKFYSAMVFLLLLLFAALPLQSLAFLFGGVAPEEVAISTLLLLVTAINFCVVGLFFSSFVRSTLAATVLGYAFPILSVFGLPLLAIILSGFVGAVFSNAFNTSSHTVGPGSEAALLYFGWFLVSIHPIATGVATEVLLLDQHTLWSYHPTLSNGTMITLISPWITYTLINLAFSMALLALCILFVRRRAR